MSPGSFPNGKFLNPKCHKSPTIIKATPKATNNFGPFPIFTFDF
tara:strand:- start:553 stop:684 length:132 start_codon:yes stop_codon:yes gene_type:complete